MSEFIFLICSEDDLIFCLLRLPLLVTGAASGARKGVGQHADSLQKLIWNAKFFKSNLPFCLRFQQKTHVFEGMKLKARQIKAFFPYKQFPLQYPLDHLLENYLLKAWYMPGKDLACHDNMIAFHIKLLSSLEKKNYWEILEL